MSARPNYQAFFDKRRRAPDRRRRRPDPFDRSLGRPSTTDPFTAKYIFPGGYIPALSEVLPAVERAGLWVTDIEILRLHYAETLRRWHDRFQARRDGDRRALRRAFLPDVGMLSGRGGDGLPLRRPHELPAQLAKRATRCRSPATIWPRRSARLSPRRAGRLSRSTACRPERARRRARRGSWRAGRRIWRTPCGRWCGCAPRRDRRRGAGCAGWRRSWPGRSRW